MKTETLALRISECIDQLGLLLDHIYKCPQKQRQAYFDRIQTIKNKLLILKSNLREGNTPITEKQYKQLYLSTNTLKNEIQQYLPLTPSVKENKEYNRYKDGKQIRKTVHDETMRMVLNKDQEIRELKELLYSKQEQLRINSDQLLNIKEDYQLVMECNRSKSVDQSHLERELDRNKKNLIRAQSDLMEIKMRQEEKDFAFNSAIEELQKLKIELITANQRIVNLNHHVEVNKVKTKVAQDIIKSDRESERPSQPYPINDVDSFKKLRDVSELQYELQQKNDAFREMQQQNKHLKEDIQVLDNQINALQGKNSQIKMIFNREKDHLLFEQKRLEKQCQSSHSRQDQLQKLFQETDKKYMIAVNKLNIAEELKIKVKESDFQNELLSEKVGSLESYIDKLQHEIKCLSKEREKVIIKQERDDLVFRELELEIFKLNQRMKLKDKDLGTLSHQLEGYKNKIRQYEKQLTLRERKEKSIESNLFEEKTRMIKLEEKDKARNKQIQGLKVKLLRAKLETIHQIRETIN